MVTVTKQFKILVIFAFIVFVVGVMIGKYSYKNQLPYKFSIYPTPTPTPVLKEVNSSDGKMKLTLKIEQTTSASYSLFVNEINGGTKKLVYNTNATTSGELVLPANAWSPDNKYFFVKEMTAQALNYLVFKGDGEKFNSGEQFLDVGATWKTKNFDFNFTEATGWASSTLIILKTVKADGSRWHSYWFEIPSKAILQLRD